MAGDEIRKDLKELKEQVEALREAFSRALEPYAELARYVEQLQEVSKGYFRLLELVQRYGAVSPDLVVPGMKDDIARHIVSTLVESPDKNISEITEAVKARRGTASRRIVRERLEELARDGIVVVTLGSRARKFRISEEIAAKWSRILMPGGSDRETAPK